MRSAIFLGLAFVFAGCSSSPSQNDGGSGDASVTDASADAPTDAPTAPTGVTYTVPQGGGSIVVLGHSQSYTFEFPPSAAGLVATIELVAPETFGLAAHPPNLTTNRYADFFKLGPSGTKFTDPVMMRPQTTNTLPPFSLLFDDGSTAGVYSRLTAGAYPIMHFSGIGFPGSPADFCSHLVLNGGGIVNNSCYQYSFTSEPPANVATVPVSGYGTAIVNCAVPETCGLTYQVCCASAADALNIGKGTTWCSSGGDPTENWCMYGVDSCNPTKPDGGSGQDCLITGLSTGADCKITFNAAACVKAESAATCNGTTCTCGTGTFPQGSLCDDQAALTTTVLANCP